MSNKYQKVINKMATDDVNKFGDLSFYSARKCLMRMCRGFKGASIQKLYRVKNTWNK